MTERKKLDYVTCSGHERSGTVKKECQVNCDKCNVERIFATKKMRQIDVELIALFPTMDNK